MRSDRRYHSTLRWAGQTVQYGTRSADITAIIGTIELSWTVRDFEVIFRAQYDV